jgi:molybdate transport system substrate-binding protein
MNRSSSWVLLLSLLAAGCARSDGQPLTVAAAASLRGVMPDLVAAWKAAGGAGEVRVTYGASGDLRKQVEGGAPIDLVVFASEKPVDDLVAGGLVDRATKLRIATNTLVLVGPKGGPLLKFATIEQLADGERVAIGEPGAVPAGQYARVAFERLGKWRALEGRMVYGGDVSSVLAYARRGEVMAAVVYKTEAAPHRDLVVLDEATGDWAPHPEVVSAIVKRAPAAAGAFQAFLISDAGQAILQRHGFGSPHAVVAVTP